MEIKALLRNRLTPIEADTPFWQAREVLKRTGARALPVLRAGELIGMLTESDVRRMGPSVVPELAQYDWTALLDGVTARQLMSPVVATLASGADVEEAARLMTELGVDSLPVVGDGGVVGVVTGGDVLEYLIETLRHRSPTGFDHVIGVCQDMETGATVAATAQELARNPGARVTLLHPLAPLDRGLRGERIRSELLAAVDGVRIRAAMEWLQGLLPAGVEPAVGYRVASGDPSRAIVKTASELGADLMVMGSGRRRGRDRARESVVEAVIRHAPCPVLAVQEDA